MRIAMLVENPLFFGGGEVHAFEISKNLLRSGQDVDFIQLYGFPFRREFASDFAKISSQVQFTPPESKLGRSLYVRILWLYSFCAIPFICRVLIKEKYDVVHVHGFGCSSLLISAVVAKKIVSSKIVCTLHNDLLRHIDRKIVENLASHVDTFVAVSMSIQNGWLAKYHVKPILIPNGVDTTRFNPEIDGSSLRKELGVDDKFVVLSVGRLSKQKGLENLIQAADYLRTRTQNLAILIGGRGEEENRLKDLAGVQGVLKTVQFVGFILPESLPLYYAACDVFVLPSVFETFGLTVLEALSTGKPIVCTRVGVAREIARYFEKSRHCVFVNHGDPRGLAEAILWFVDNQEFVRENAKTVSETIRTNFTWESVSDRINVLYEQVAK